MKLFDEYPELRNDRVFLRKMSHTPSCETTG